MIEIKNLSYAVGDKTILNNISTVFEAGKITALIGANGSGKSTLAKHLNALYVPQTGSVTVDRYDTRSRKALKTIRSSVGMVFQDPTLQAVAPTVIEDIAFAPEHLGLPPEETLVRISDAMSLTGTEHLKNDRIDTLSGGEKQLVAIAGVLAMNPQYIIFDEATSMLDPMCREKIFAIAKELANKGLGIIWITQNMEEAELCDIVTVMANGQVKVSDTPQKIFYDNDVLQYGIKEPQIITLKKAIITSGLSPDDILRGREND